MKLKLTMDLTKLTKQELTAALTKQQLATQEALNVANYFYAHIDEIDKKFISLNVPTKGIKLFWIWKNRLLILEVITFIIDRIKEIKAKVQEINDRATKSNGPAQ